MHHKKSDSTSGVSVPCIVTEASLVKTTNIEQSASRIIFIRINHLNRFDPSCLVVFVFPMIQEQNLLPEVLTQSYQPTDNAQGNSHRSFVTPYFPAQQCRAASQLLLPFRWSQMMSSGPADFSPARLQRTIVERYEPQAAWNTVSFDVQRGKVVSWFLLKRQRERRNKNALRSRNEPLLYPD
jgi:hypothetical protein